MHAGRIGRQHGAESPCTGDETHRVPVALSMPRIERVRIQAAGQTIEDGPHVPHCGGDFCMFCRHRAQGKPVVAD